MQIARAARRGADDSPFIRRNNEIEPAAGATPPGAPQRVAIQHFMPRGGAWARRALLTAARPSPVAGEDSQIYCRSARRVNLQPHRAPSTNYFAVNELRRRPDAAASPSTHQTLAAWFEIVLHVTKHRAGLLAALVATSALGCIGSPGGSGQPDLVWGKQGLSNGDFQKPRGIAISSKDEIYIVDMTARIQVFDLDGNF